MISVIMSVYNEELNWLKEAVASVLNQTYADFEYLIIIDNPHLNEEAVSYLKKIDKEDSRVHLHFNKKNIGLMNCLNKGIGMARGEYIARMDADDISVPDRLEKEKNYLELNGLDMVSSNRIDIDEKGRIIGRSHNERKKPEKHLPYTNFIVHSSVLIRTEVLKALGGYREFYNSEDYDLWLRMLSSGYKIGIIEEPLILYRIRLTSMSLKNRLESYYITKYQQNLFWERIKKGEDSFSKSNFKAYMEKKDLSERNKNRYSIFREKMDTAIEQARKKDIRFIPSIARAIFAYPTIAIDAIRTIVHMV